MDENKRTSVLCTIKGSRRFSFQIETMIIFVLINSPYGHSFVVHCNTEICDVVTIPQLQMDH